MGQVSTNLLFAHFFCTVRMSVLPAVPSCAMPVQVLLRLSACGHKVLLFCTMTRCLDLIEEYLTWR